MKPSLIRILGQRFGALLSTLVAVCAVLTTVSVLEARQIGASTPAAATPGSTSDTLGSLRQAARHLDQLRGLEALHLLATSAAEKRSYEIALGGQRRAIEALIGRSHAVTGDAADRQFGERVRADLAAYLVLQDQLLALSQRALNDAARGADARQLLGGGSQVLFERLRERLDAWWTHRESQGRDGTHAERAQVTILAWAVAVLGCVALVLAATLRWAHGRDTEPVAAKGAAAAEPTRVEQVQALVDAVRGSPATSVAAVATANPE